MTLPALLDRYDAPALDVLQCSMPHSDGFGERMPGTAQDDPFGAGEQDDAEAIRLRCQLVDISDPCLSHDRDLSDNCDLIVAGLGEYTPTQQAAA